VSRLQKKLRFFFYFAKLVTDYIVKAKSKSEMWFVKICPRRQNCKIDWLIGWLVSAAYWLLLTCGIEYTSPWTGFELTTLMVMGTDCIGSYKNNHHIITTRAPSPSPCNRWIARYDYSFRRWKNGQVAYFFLNNITDLHDITEILLKVALNTIILAHCYTCVRGTIV
jgi:hypothetical protein